MIWSVVFLQQTLLLVTLLNSRWGVLTRCAVSCSFSWLDPEPR